MCIGTDELERAKQHRSTLHIFEERTGRGEHSLSDGHKHGRHEPRSSSSQGGFDFRHHCKTAYDDRVSLSHHNYRSLASRCVLRTFRSPRPNPTVHGLTMRGLPRRRRCACRMSWPAALRNFIFMVGLTIFLKKRSATHWNWRTVATHRSRSPARSTTPRPRSGT